MRHPLIACSALLFTACAHLAEPTPRTAASSRAKQGGGEVDLLHAVEADVAVSSTYRDQRSQVDALVDGDLETAWNSRTGELVGAWIEVRLPESAQVTSIAMTVGFTHVSGESDLFTATTASRECGCRGMGQCSASTRSMPSRARHRRSR